MGLRDGFSHTTTEKSFSCDTLSGAMSGFAGSGKSHTLAMLTGEVPPSLRVSTAISRTPLRTITHATIGVDQQNTFTAISDSDYTDKFLVTSREGVSVHRPPSFLRKLFHRPSVPIYQVEKDFIY